MPIFYRLLVVAFLVIALGGSCAQASPQLPAPTAPPLLSSSAAQPISTTTPTFPPKPSPSLTAPLPDIPYDQVSQESLLAYLTDLVSIQPYSGWRNSGSSGEADALDYVAGKLAGFYSLKDMGLEVERQSFPVYLSAEIWDSTLALTINGKEVEVLADGLRGGKSFRPIALYFDTDGIQGDSDRNPITAQGAPLVVRDAESLFNLTKEELQGRILFLDNAVTDIALNEDALDNGSQVMSLIDQGLSGLVMITEYSNQVGGSRGTTLGDGGIFLYGAPTVPVPVLYVRLEDMQPAGISTWEDVQKIETARLVLDQDVYSPGKGGSLVARIPGADPTRAVILSAHIDSPNSPGALDDGSGSAALLEVARVLDATRFQPAVDVYLAWFGSHEIGVYGSANFVSTHQELLDRSLGMISMDGLGMPMEGKNSKITLVNYSYSPFGDERTPFPDFLQKVAAAQGLELDLLVSPDIFSDNANFDTFNVPNVYLGYMDASLYQQKGSTYFHYANHWHDPYETVDLARQVGDIFVDMTKVMLAAALETGRTRPDLHVPLATVSRSLYIASHTELVNVPTTMLRELGMALAWEGFDVDLVPYGQTFTLTDLQQADVVVIPPAMDFPGKTVQKWSETELAALEGYVSGGGFLIVINSHCIYNVKRCLDDPNEDAWALNPLLEPMGIRFMYGGSLGGSIALATSEHPLTENASYVSFYDGQSVLFRMKAGLELLQAEARPIAALVDFGDRGGQVLVIADLGLLQTDSKGAKNWQFLQNIAHYARTR